MIVGFTGSRQGVTPLQDTALRTLFQKFMPIDRLHHGACVGADQFAHDLGRELGIAITMWPSNGDQHQWACSHAQVGDRIEVVQHPLVRNRKIVIACDVLIASPRSPVEMLRSGTWATVRYARELGKTRYVVRPDGSVEESHGEQT